MHHRFPDVSPFHALINGIDWSASPLGPVARWPLALRANTNLMLEALVPMSIVWGPQRILLYNEAYTRFLGDKHPWALGRPLDQVWPEIWDRIGPLVDRARGGEAFHLEDLSLPIERDGKLQPAWFTFFYSPVRDDAGQLAGMCSTVVETTSRMLAEQHALQLNRTLEERVASGTADLRRSQAHLESLFEQTAAGIAETALDGRVLRANQTFCRIVGRTHDEVAGMPLEALVHPEDLEENLALFRGMVAKAEPFEIENRYLRPDGTTVWVAKTVTPIVESGGESRVGSNLGAPTSILANVVDITPRKEAELLLRANAERLRLALDAASLGIWSWDVADEQPRWENDRLYEMVGIARSAEPVDTVRLLAELIHPDDIAPYQAAMARALETGEAFRFEGRFYRASDRALRWFEFTGALHRDEAGRVLRMVGTTADVTERRLVQDRLQTREERYRTLLTSIDEAFCVIELLVDASGAIADHRFVEVNPAFERHTGLKDVVGKTIRELAPGVQSIWSEHYARVSASGEPLRVVQYEAALGRWFDVFIAKADARVGNRVAVVFRDISEQRRADEDLRALAADLAQANRRQSEFLATLAHELRNPLAPIKTGLDLMRLSPGDPAAAARVRAMMERQTNHLIHLVNDLLDLARVQSGKIELQKARVALQDIVRSAVETALPLIDSKRHAFRAQLPEAPLLLDADANRLAQVIGNLLANAAKYTPPGGSIVLSARQEGDAVRIDVSDNGIGLPADALPTLFEMFNQGRHGMDYAQGGLGIGLNLVRRLTEKHGGSVSAASEGANRGSTFTLRLPLAPAGPAPGASPALPAAPAQTEAPAPGRCLRILVADDNQDAADLLAQLLQSQGHAVRTVHDGSAALAAAQAEVPDLALLDIGMPGLTGYEVASALRKLPALRHTVLAAVTGWGAQHDRARAREAGFDHHMTKPVDFQNLDRLLARILDGRRAKRA
ncbi:PAS domain S-box protein [Massilia sp. GCM10023247]|uniref:PAS domain S-box protein n=1 Tax=Massilia sp. GCM10023247 TaxID=3252643 RepID=UPI003614292C